METSQQTIARLEINSVTDAEGMIDTISEMISDCADQGDYETIVILAVDLKILAEYIEENS